jgi:putative tryptophan/tyrosine transport system substrate-binding protein
MIRRREFVAGIGSAAAWPLAAGPLAAQVQQRIPVVGVLSMAGVETSPINDEFGQALKDTGFVPGRNVTFEFRFASGQPERLPALAAELVGRKVDVIYASGAPAAAAAKAATATIPIVFTLGEDPVASSPASTGRAEM